MQQSSILPFLQKRRPAQPGSSRPGQPYQSRPSNSRDVKNQHRGPNRRRNADLQKIADETKDVLPKVLSAIPDFGATKSSIHNLAELTALDRESCPGFVLPPGDEEAGKKGTRIRVWDMDTFDAALDLAPEYKVHIHLGYPRRSTNDEDKKTSKNPGDDEIMKDESQESRTTSLTSADMSNMGRLSLDANSMSRAPKPVAVLNLASERHAGGGWQKGALAQEEALCYRSSLYLSLHKSYYRLPSLSAIYSPNVLIIRDAMSRGHNLLVPAEPPANLPVTSVISVAALRHPALTDDKMNFKNAGQRAETKRKIRVTLRVAAMNGHTKLVLGALGCGVFANPPREVAECFLEVMREQEFQGGLWEDVVFAIMDNVRGPNGGKDGVGNYGVFYQILDGMIV